MILTNVRLESDHDTLPLDPLKGWGTLNIDLGDPVTREYMENRPDEDGADDYTEFVGASNVTISFELVELDQDMWSMITRLRGFTAPRTPVRMYFQLSDTAPEVYADLRRNTFTNPLNNLWVTNPVIQWTNPGGVWKTVAESSVNVQPNNPLELGRSYDRIYGDTVSISWLDSDGLPWLTTPDNEEWLTQGLPGSTGEDRGYPSMEPLGSVQAINNGNTAARPLIRIYGPCIDPAISNETTGKGFYTIPGELTIEEGDYVEINYDERTILVNGDDAFSVYDAFDWSISEWWTLQRGVNLIKFNPDSYQPGAYASVTWNDTFYL